MKRKLLGTTLAFALAISVAACGTTEEAADTTASEETVESTSEDYSYVLMNVPYSEFFASEYEGGEAVEAVSSATLQKAAVSDLTGGSYHVSDNSQILGVSCPVAVPGNVTLDESLKLDSEEALYDAADYSYIELTETPAYYKVLSLADGIYSFSASVGEAEEVSYNSVSLTTSSVWGDYEIDFDESVSEYATYAATLHTAEGNTYGLRSLENLWRGFEIGFTTSDSFTDPHHSKLSYEPYADLPGQTIDEIVYYTADGIKKFTVNLYVPYKFENTIAVADAAAADGVTSVSFTGFPEDYEFTYEVNGGSSDATCDGKNISWTAAVAGTYTLMVSDAAGKYAPYSQNFVLSTDKQVAEEAEEAIVKTADATDEEFSAFISNITSYIVNGEEVSGSGHGAAQLISADGSVDKTQSRVFSEVGDYEVTIISAGYPGVTVNVTITEVAEEKSQGKGKH